MSAIDRINALLEASAKVDREIQYRDTRLDLRPTRFGDGDKVYLNSKHTVADWLEAGHSARDVVGPFWRISPHPSTAIHSVDMTPESEQELRDGGHHQYIAAIKASGVVHDTSSPAATARRALEKQATDAGITLSKHVANIILAHLGK